MVSEVGSENKKKKIQINLGLIERKRKQNKPVKTAMSCLKKKKKKKKKKITFERKYISSEN